jgi:hypothetical protein
MSAESLQIPAIAGAQDGWMLFMIILHTNKKGGYTLTRLGHFLTGDGSSFCHSHIKSFHSDKASAWCWFKLVAVIRE